MYYVYSKENGAKNLVKEYSDVKKALDYVEAEVDKNKDFKYVIEETTGQMDSYGELIVEVFDEN